MADKSHNFVLHGHSNCHASVMRLARPRGCRAIVLLEVIFSITLMVAAAAVILDSLNACTRLVGRTRTKARAADLAVTYLSRIQKGYLDAEDDGPNECEEDEDWTWQIVSSPVDDASDQGTMKRVEVIIANGSEGYTCRLVHLMPAEVPAGPVAGGAEPPGAGGEP